MAKDRFGHGSNGRGVSAVQARNDRMFAMFDRARAQGHTGLYSGPDKAAADTLAQGGAKSATPEIHGGMKLSDMNDEQKRAVAARDLKHETDDYNRDLSLRMRNGQVGSGMKFRG